MSFKKSKLDLLVRVRYTNPLPAPPCPPKLLDIPTNPMRYARPEFLNSLANDTPLPMIVDAECGMSLNLGRWEELWEENPDDSGLNPDPENLPTLDPRDAYLLGDPAVNTSPFPNGSHSASNTGTSTPLPAHVPWLRKTEYISREGVQRANLQEPKPLMSARIDVSRSAQISDIEASFAACNENFSLSSLRHPNKPDVRAVESYEIFPDTDIWPNAYDLFRFSERPGERVVDAEDPRLDCAILRPMESDGDHFLAYYLTQDDDSAIHFKNARFERAAYEVPENQEPTVFHFVRDYETFKVEQEVPNEFLLVLDDGDSSSFNDIVDAKPQARRKLKGAYYKNIERKMSLKKKRVNAHEAYQDKWEIIKVTHLPMSTEEEEERMEALMEVTDPTYWIRGDADPDAEGEVEDDSGIGAGNVGEVNVKHMYH